MRQFRVVLLGCVAVVVSGCGGEQVSVRWGDPPPRRRVVYVEETHICTRLCHDHYWNGSRVVVLSGHRHYDGCGHVFRGGRWIVVAGHGDRVRVTEVHRCTRRCSNHYWTGGKMVVLTGHRHGPGCGHFFSNSRWLAVKSKSHKARAVKPRKARAASKHSAPSKRKSRKSRSRRDHD